MNKYIHMKGSEEGVLLENIPVLRQAFVVASLLIIVGVVCGYYISAWFLLLPLLVSGGLLFSGLVGWCPMALILQAMPWNKK